MLPWVSSNHDIKSLGRYAVFRGLNPQQYHAHLRAVAMNKHHSLSSVHKHPDRPGKCCCGSLLSCGIVRIEEQGISAKGENCRSCQFQSPLMRSLALIWIWIWI